MERLLKMAGKASDQAELYFLEHQSDQIQFENGRLGNRIQDAVGLQPEDY